MQETWVWSLIWDLTCHGTPKSSRCNYWACALSSGTTTIKTQVPWSLCSAAREATAGRSRTPKLEGNPHSPQLDKSLRSSEDPAQPKVKQKKTFYLFIKKKKKLLNGGDGGESVWGVCRQNNNGQELMTVDAGEWVHGESLYYSLYKLVNNYYLYKKPTIYIF